MQVSQSAEAKIPAPRSPLHLTTADYCSVPLSLFLCECTHTAHTSEHAEVSREQVEQLTDTLQTLWLTFS